MSLHNKLYAPWLKPENCLASDTPCATRIEEEVVVTSEGAEVITKFPAQELFVANAY